MTPTRNLALIVLLLLSVFAPKSAVGEQVADATYAAQKITDFHDLLIRMMQVSDPMTRAEMVRPQIESLFDIEKIASVSLGRTWRSLETTDRHLCVNRLTDLIVATYADRFKQFSGQSFQTLESRKVANGEVVRTTLNTGKTEVKLDYFLRDGRVFNVAADGVSDLSLPPGRLCTNIENGRLSCVDGPFTTKD